MAVNMTVTSINVQGAVPINGRLVLNSLDGEPLPESGLTLTPLSTEGFFLDTSIITTMRDSYANDSVAYDKLNSHMSQWLTGDFTQQYNVQTRGMAIYSLYLINQDPTYLARAKEIFEWKYLDPAQAFPPTNSGYHGANQIRAIVPPATRYYSWMKQHLTASQIDSFQETVKAWAEYHLDHEGYYSDWSGVRERDTDHHVSMTENMISWALVIDDPLVKAKCLAGFEHFYTVLLDEIIGKITADGLWCEGTSYNSNTLQNLFRLMSLAKKYTNVSIPTEYLENVWRRYMTQYLNFDSTKLWYHSDLEGNPKHSTEQDEERYINFYDTAMAVYKDTSIEGEVKYCRDLIDSHNLDDGDVYRGEMYLLAYDTRVSNINPNTVTPEFMYSNEGMTVNVFHSDWSANNSTLIHYAHKELVDHVHMHQNAFDLWDGETPITKGMSAYYYYKPNNQIYVLGHNEVERSGTLYGYTKGAPTLISAEAVEDYQYICSDAKDMYNQEGWKKYTFVNQASRAMLHLPDVKTMIVFDRMVTDPNVVEDMTSINPVAPYAREMFKRNRWLDTSSPPTFSNGVYRGSFEGKEQVYQSLLPVDSIEIVSEAVIYAGASESSTPTAQRAFQTKENITSNDGRWLNITNYGDDGTVVASTYSLITVVSGNVVGAVIDDTTAVLFNLSPDVSITGSIDITVPTSVTTLYVLGIYGSFDISTTAVGDISIDTGSSVTTTNQQVLKTTVSF